MAQFGFYFDADNCIGCRTCQIACKDRNGLEVGELYRRVSTFETGSFPTPRMYNYASTCNHCAMPACMANCSAGAISKDADTGIVLIDEEKCTGCGACVESCPYGVPVMIESKGIAGKCDTCKSIRDAGGNPTCVDACIARVLDFGDIEELRAKHGDDCVNEIACLPSPDMTNPSVLIKAKDCMFEEDFVEALM